MHTTLQNPGVSHPSFCNHMNSIAWRFLEVRPEGVNQDPTQREFFAPEEGVTGALVREALQNSLDARPKNPTGPAVVQFHFGSDQEQTLETSSYFQTLRDHLKTEFSELPAPEHPVSFLTIEDFGTRGLQGDPCHTIYDEHDAGKESKNDFFYFWRNVGRSRKEATDRGRWGLGKTVFPASSTISSFFGLTVRKSDGRRLLMGQSVLKVHTLTTEDGGTKIYEPYGFFGRYEGSNLALPFEEVSVLQEFAARFGVSREDEPGLSIVVPFPLTDLSPRSVAQEVIRSYYVSILSGELQVKVSNSQEAYDITRDSIIQTAMSLPWAGHKVKAKDVADRIRFADRALQTPVNSLTKLDDQHSTRAPDSLRDRVPADSIKDLREKFDAGDLLAFRVPVLVKRGGGNTVSYFDAYIQRDTVLSTGTAEFVREGLAITQTGKTPRQPVRGLVLVRDKELSTLLGDAENPAHTKWQELSDKIKEAKYIHGRSTIRLVNSSLQQLTDHLSFRTEARDLNLLADIFFLPQEPDHLQIKNAGTKESAKGTTSTPESPPPAGVRPVTLSQVRGGFRLSANPKSEIIPEFLAVEAAYAIRNGNPFRRYRTFDFDLGNTPIRGKGVKVLRAAENRMLLQITDSDFLAEVLGFDENRDLEVKVVVQETEAN